MSSKAKNLGRIGLRALVGVTTSVFLVYWLVFWYLVGNQRALIFPGSVKSYSNSQAVTIPSGSRMLTLITRHGVALPSLYCSAETYDGIPDPRSNLRPTILFFYGNGGNINGFQNFISRLRTMDCNVIIPEYPGYGSAGGFASEDGCFDAADAAYQYVKTKAPGNTPIISSGWSLGSGVAIHLAATRPVAGLIIFSAYTSMAEMASYQYPMYPAPLLRSFLKYQFPSRLLIHRVNCPTFIAHGTLDPVVPFFMFKEMVRSCAGSVTSCVLPGVGHDVPDEMSNELLSNRIYEWIVSITSRNGR